MGGNLVKSRVGVKPNEQNVSRPPGCTKEQQHSRSERKDVSINQSVVNWSSISIPTSCPWLKFRTGPYTQSSLSVCWTCFIFHTCVPADRCLGKPQTTCPHDLPLQTKMQTLRLPARRQESGGFCGERKKKQGEAGAGPSEP